MPFDLDNTIGFVVGRTTYMMRRLFTDRFQAHGFDITPEEWAVLNRLWQCDGQRPAELADSTIRDRTTMTRLLDRLVEKGLVRREPDNRDRRAVRTWLTPEGGALQGKLIPVAEQLFRDVTDGVPRREIQQTIDTIKKIQKNLIARTLESSE